MHGCTSEDSLAIILPLRPRLAACRGSVIVPLKCQDDGETPQGQERETDKETFKKTEASGDRMGDKTKKEGVQGLRREHG